MKILRSGRDGDRKITAETDEARQATTGHNVRYVLFFGILGVVICFAIILVIFSLVR
jgi:hypothetical protein